MVGIASDHNPVCMVAENIVKMTIDGARQANPIR